ncbi:MULTISPECIES: bifunctional diaminohydroxyphosphoribosylaminopyrimidine deaminase/5-amino-6-(5-phosphoribosylamino)uracil reductase RibD [Auritidibacter]|uniref:bifunctional diaminohydroxyphosphoribosylaminopyrimidine deaminase/5-amino-6-(5-phosphoribosylamino)uracil reductase RibD n=1 Tax=Auritidibacter TaxID=1160973 RepID=UPI000D737AF3|nr:MULTISPECIES: bifunctional diaminohydroxyphosphoribosylaminopyrimidine deaminase/5-amino-6-(5-phosphoribosylamino)uracil reductase RibD [Auritidibacter]PXA75515.1 bifunctional diaminohydroxyphosphoribosylaminopyrimidine deaminase/5-amino-6-(5-phosphoribosylamino)uracil reductase RibD [Auritidibacter sp. NML100628]WGH82913.1 bifunctional diaminohydroxyphosphoribosylaminopyrimidine deaminase/5-amino-6-(5-phosphoribosylamino)uracil reductase RibD [Auritidibacter ignavus]
MMNTENPFSTVARAHRRIALDRAFQIARFGPADTANPQVGCVLIDPAGRIRAEGWHRGAGTDHAEVDALRQLPASWADRGHELTAVITLEPCHHTGRTGPCAQALLEAGIATVVYAMDDPTPTARGGADFLASHGVQVIGPVDPVAGYRLLGTWLARTLPRPQITVKWAQSVDGRIAAPDGTSQWITGPTARADAHRRRAAADAILVGTGTVLADDPALTARTAQGELLVPADEQPVPIVLGSRDIPDTAAVHRSPALAARGLHSAVRLTPQHPGELLLEFASLRDQGITSVLVDGGPRVISSLIREHLVDEFLIYTAPVLLGGPRTALDDIGVTSLEQAPPLIIHERHQLGADHVTIATPAPYVIPSTTEEHHPIAYSPDRRP